MGKQNSKFSLKIEWILFGIIFSFLFLNFLYSDILITTNASITFDDLFFRGDLYQLYSATYQSYDGLFASAFITYDFPIYIFFGLWNLPLWIYTSLTGAHWELSYFAILYAKLFLVVLTILAFIVMNQILKYFGFLKEDQKMYQFLFLSSSLTLMVLAMFGGYDILSIIFVLLGIYFYLKDDLLKFIFFFAIAISLKLFALFIFIPLLLLKEKNIWKILGYGLLSLSILVLSKFIYWNAPMYYESMHAFEDNMFGKLSLSYIPTPFGNVSIFMTIYILICCWCYGKKFQDKKIGDLYTMYLPLVIYGFFCIFCQSHPQWIILLIPYMIFFLVYNKQNKTFNLILESVFSVSMLGIFYQVYTWVFNPSLMNHMLLSRLVPQVNGIVEISRFHIDQFSPLLNAVALGTFIYFLWLNRPEKIVHQEREENWQSSFLLLRTCLIVPFALVLIYYYFR